MEHPGGVGPAPALACRTGGLNMRHPSNGASLAPSEAKQTDPMLQFLFPRLTPRPAGGAALFDAVTARAREPHWYVEGEVPDSVDGRFRVLATIAALVTVRLEQIEGGDAASVALTERFIEVMEAEHREMGLGDPGLGRTVRKLVGSLARRVELWRGVVAGETGWNEAAARSVYRGDAPGAAVDHTGAALRSLWSELARADAAALVEGRIE
jgi:cytochrome b pre-mRNA-processing protein 3